MKFNNISNTGNGNVFNQNIGGQSIFDIFDREELADEWRCRKKNYTDAYQTRIRTSIVQVIIALILLLACFGIAVISGDFESIPAFISYLRELSIGAVGTLLTFIGGLIFAALGTGGFCHQSEREKRNKEAMRQIDARAEDLGFSKKDWKVAKKGRKST